MLTALGIGAGVLLRTPTPAKPAVLHYGAPLPSVDTTVMRVARRAFCAKVPRADVRAALGGAPRSVSAYSPGQRVAPLHDVVDEYGCVWRGRSTTARAWVFGTPVTRAWAKTLAAVPHRCAAVHGGRFGHPSVAYACGGTTTFAGLFGDAWLTCSLTSHATTRVGRWCVAAARSAS